MNPSLQGYTAAVMEAVGADALGDLARDLEAIEQLVLGNGTLRSALSDTAVPGTARRAVMLDLLEGKVGAAARRLAAYACMVVPAQEVTAALGWVSQRVRLAVESGEFRESTLGLAQARQRVAGYATGLYEDMSTHDLESLEDDLFRFARIVDATPRLRTALTDRDLDVEARRGLVTQLLDGKVPATTVSLVRYVVVGGRARDFVGTVDFLVEQTAQARGWRIAYVRSALPVEDPQREALTASLGSLAGAPVELQVEIDESLLTGVRIRIGDLQIDATARGRIDALREHITPAGWEPSRIGGTTSSSADTEGAD